MLDEIARDRLSQRALADRIGSMSVGFVNRCLGRLVDELGDDAAKHGIDQEGVCVHAPSDISKLDAGAVVITTCKHAPTIEGRLNPFTDSACPVWRL